MPTTVAEALYEEHADALYAYCRTLAGDAAPDVMRDVFAAAVPERPSPARLYELARAACALRTPPVEQPGTPLARALARLRPEHREVLQLGAVLEPEEVAQVLQIATDTATQLHWVAERRLEHAVVTVLSGRGVQDDALVTALGSGKLAAFATRAPVAPPALREHVLPVEPDLEQTVVVLGRSARTRRRPVWKRDGVLEIVGVAACVAAALGIFTLWPERHPNGSENMNGVSVMVHRHSSPAVPGAAGATPQGNTAAAPSPTGTPTTAPPATDSQPATSATSPTPTRTPTSSPTNSAKPTPSATPSTTPPAATPSSSLTPEAPAPTP